MPVASLPSARSMRKRLPSFRRRTNSSVLIKCWPHRMTTEHCDGRRLVEEGPMKTSLHPVILVAILLRLKCGSVNKDGICIVLGGTDGGALPLAEHSRKGKASPLLVNTTYRASDDHGKRGVACGCTQRRTARSHSTCRLPTRRGVSDWPSWKRWPLTSVLIRVRLTGNIICTDPERARRCLYSHHRLIW